MAAEIITIEDLEVFRLKLLEDIKELLNQKQQKKWLKTHEVTEMLDMSEVTLQTLRNRGILPYHKLGSICYYHIDELDEAMKKL